GRQDEARQGHPVLVRAAGAVGQVGEVADLVGPLLPWLEGAQGGVKPRLEKGELVRPQAGLAVGVDRGGVRVLRGLGRRGGLVHGGGRVERHVQVLVGEQVRDRRRLGQRLGQGRRGADRTFQV